MLIAGIIIAGVELVTLIGYGTYTNDDFWSF